MFNDASLVDICNQLKRIADAMEQANELKVIEMQERE